MRKRHLDLSWLGVFALTSLACRDIPPRFDGQRAHDWVATLAADELGGRRTGTPDGAAAADLIAEAFDKAGLEPAGDQGSYLHRFTFPYYQIVPPARLALGRPGPQNRGEGLNGRELVYGQDFYFLNGSSATDGEAEVVFVGYGLSTPTLDELAGVDVVGKVLLAIEGLPPGSDLDRSLAANFSKARRARELGAAGILFVSDPSRGSTFPETRIWVFRPDRYLPGFFLAKIDLRIADELLDGKAVALKQTLDAGGLRSHATGRTVSWRVTPDYIPEKEGANVVGLIPGDDPHLKDQLILVGAHYDGGGRDPDGTIYNGAEDNAAGTSVIIELARVMAAKGPAARSIMFAAWGAEEQGAWGSKRFVEEQRWPVDKIVFTINLDNVGVGEGRFLLYAARNFPEALALIQGEVPADLFAHFTPRGAGGSDGWTFQTLGVPTFFAHSDAPQLYVHTPGDDVSTIAASMLEIVGRFSVEALTAAANAPADAFDGSRRLERYLSHSAYVVALLPKDAAPDWRQLRRNGVDLLLIEGGSRTARSSLEADLPEDVVVANAPADISSDEEGGPLHVVFLEPGDLDGGPEVVRLATCGELPPSLLDPTRNVALLFDAPAGCLLDTVSALVKAGTEAERIEGMLGRLRTHLMTRLKLRTTP